MTVAIPCTWKNYTTNDLISKDDITGKPSKYPINVSFYSINYIKAL